MEAISYQITIEIEGAERVIEEILVQPKVDDIAPGKEEFEGVLVSVRDSLANQGLVGPLSLYRVDRTLEAEVEAVELAEVEIPELDDLEIPETPVEKPELKLP